MKEDRQILLGSSTWRVTHSLPDEINPVTETVAMISRGIEYGPEWIDATVPGDVQTDALEAGIIANPVHGLDSRLAEWTYQRDWTYYRTFELKQPPQATDRIVLCFDGVDYACQVFLNGQWLGDHEGAWSGFEFDITDIVVFDKPNTLVVVVQHAPDEQCQWGRTSRVKTLKARYAYGWDWCTRLMPLGIWKQVRLVTRGIAYVRDLTAKIELDSDLRSASVHGQLEVTAQIELPVDVVWVLSLDGHQVAGLSSSVDLPRGEHSLQAQLAVTDPKLWYPNGYGAQPVYELSCLLRNRSGQLLDQLSVPLGLRKIEWYYNDGAPASALPYCLKVNGRRVFLKGWNWTPLDQLYGRTAFDRYERRLSLAKRAHCNLIRVWGGGIAERQVFYDCCDALGIMVWQDLFLCSGNVDNHPPLDDAFACLLDKEVQSVVLKLRNHPCLVVWCGGSELSVRGDIVDEHDHAVRAELVGRQGYGADVRRSSSRPLSADHPVLKRLGETVRQLDPERHWLPTSASGPTENASLERVGQMHDVHGPWEHLGPQEHYLFYNSVDMMLHSEFGCDGASSVRAIKHFVPRNRLWPLDASNPVAWHHGRMWTSTNRVRTQTFFGEIDDLQTYVRASQHVQAEGLQYAIESHRRQKWRRSGAIAWHFAEPWPNVCDTCSVDYYDQTKPAYYAYARAMRPIHVSAKYESTIWNEKNRFVAELWGHNSTETSVSGTVSVGLWSLAGTCVYQTEKPVRIRREAAEKLCDVSAARELLPQPTFLLHAVLADRSGREISQHCSLHSTVAGAPLAHLRSLPEGMIDVTVRESGFDVRNTGESVIVGFWLESSVNEKFFLDDNWLCLFPSEIRRFTVTGCWHKIDASAWNLSEVAIRSRRRRRAD